MNRLDFKINETDSGYWGVIPVIDGVPFPQMLKQVERPFAEREGHLGLAGKYAGPLISNIGNPHEYFFGRSRFTHENGKTPVLECDCGTEGCWPLLAEISADAKHVHWREFEQPHRRIPSTLGHWSYEGLGEFLFSKSNYIAALDALMLEIRKNCND